MRSLTTTPLTNTRKCANGSRSIRAGPSTSRQPRHHGSMPSKASSPSSQIGASNAACFDPSPTLRTPSTTSSPRPMPQTLRVDRTPKPHPRRCQKREGKVRVDPLAALVLAATVYIGAIARPDPYPIPAKDAQARFPESKETRVNSFTYQAADPTNAGPRYWRRSVSGDGWVERTPAGDESFFQIDKRTNYGGCDGTVVSKIGEPNFQLLIPDRGCPNMELKFRRSTNENWMGLPRMENIL